MNKFSGNSNELHHFLVFDKLKNSSLIKIKEKINAHMGINVRVWVLFLRKMTNFIIHFIKCQNISIFIIKEIFHAHFI